MKILIEAVLSAALSISCLCGAEPYIMTSTVPQPLERYTSALSEHGESQALAPSAPEQYDAALSDALHDITAVAAETRENSLGHADAVDSSPSDADTEISSVPESISAAATDPDAFSGSSDTAAADASGGYDTTDEYAEDTVYFGYTDDSVIYVYDHTTGSTITTTLGEYVEGVCRAEMPRYFDIEALRAQAIAARSYAVYKLMQGPPDAEHGRACVCNEPAHCCAYRSAEGAYTDEATAAASETRNTAVTYDGMSICAAWHARSVGYTRSAVDVWGGNAPYLVSVPTEEDSAACLGHGVGMSQYGALAMAQRGLTAEDILMHYYTGCELSRLG